MEVTYNKNNNLDTNNPFRLQRDNKRFFLDLAKSNLQIIKQEEEKGIYDINSGVDYGYSGRFNNDNTNKLYITNPNGHQKNIDNNNPIMSYSLLNHKQVASRIKNINQQLQQLARRKEQVLFKDAQLDYIFKKKKPNIRLQDFIDKDIKQRKFRVRAVLKQKKQTIHEFMEKKKQIFITKMNINTKKDQTNKLEDYIKDQKQTLKARQLYYKNDVQFMNKFIAQIKKQAEDAQNYYELQLKIQEQLTSTLNSIETQIQKKQNIRDKAKQDFRNLTKYKQFLDKFLKYNNSSWKRYKRKQQKKDKQIVFLTQDMNNHKNSEQQKIIIPFSPQNLLDIFNQIEENNIGQIMNLHNSEEQLQKVIMNKKELTVQIEGLQAQYKNRIKILEKSLDNCMKNNIRLKQIKKNNKNTIKVTDDQDVDLEKIGAKIMSIYIQMNPKFSKNGQSRLISSGSDRNPANDSKQLKRCMTQIQHDIFRIWQFLKHEKEVNPKRNQQIQKQIKQNHKKQNLLKKQLQSKQNEIRKQEEEANKRIQQKNQPINKGRKAMTRVLLQKRKKAKKEEIMNQQDKDLKYFVMEGQEIPEQIIKQNQKDKYQEN